MILSEKDYGKEFLIELDKVLKIRKQRRKIYGDNIYDMDSNDMFTFIKSKFLRLKFQHFSKNSKYEDAEDTAIDLIAYCLFYLMMKEKERKGKKR